jgi:hypothetical protein
LVRSPGALPVLPFGADQGAQNERRRQADQRVEKIGRLEGGQESHAGFPERFRAQWIPVRVKKTC